jgi:hypothetical protein
VGDGAAALVPAGGVARVEGSHATEPRAKAKAKARSGTQRRAKGFMVASPL